MAQYRNILGGPSKFDLMLALFDNRFDGKRYVQFNLQAADGTNEVKTQSFTGPNAVRNMLAAMDKLPTVVEADISRIEREDGSAESWNIEGRLGVDGYPRFKAHFDTRTRKGSLTLVG